MPLVKNDATFFNQKKEKRKEREREIGNRFFFFFFVIELWNWKCWERESNVVKQGIHRWKLRKASIWDTLWEMLKWKKTTCGTRWSNTSKWKKRAYWPQFYGNRVYKTRLTSYNLLKLIELEFHVAFLN